MRVAQAFLMILGLSVATSAVPNFVERKYPGRPNLVGRKPTAAFDTNAKRFAAGLPPLPARRLWSRTDTAKRWSTSPVPFKGKTSITATNGTFIGFISKVLSCHGTYVADLNEPNAALISFTAASFGKSSGLLLKDETSTVPSAPYLGAVVQHGFSLSPRNGWKRDGTQSGAPVVGTGQSAPNSPPHSITSTYNSTGGTSNGVSGPVQSNNNYDGESGIWTYDAQIKQWTAIWTNPDSSSVATTPYYNPDTPPGIVLVSDVPAYTAENPHAFPITLNFSP